MILKSGEVEGFGGGSGVGRAASCCKEMHVRIEHSEALTPLQMGAFLRASEAIGFAGQSRAEVYAWVEATLLGQEYFRQGKKTRGVIRSYLSKMSGRSLAQVTRLIRQYRLEGHIRVQAYRRHRFPRRYTDRDVALLAEVDQAHEWLSGPATKHIPEREFAVFGKAEFERLAGISVAHLYNLRQSARHRRCAARWEPTRPTSVSIGERRRPEPNGRPGYVRVDTVHQGDWEGAKGVYHLNAVDTVTQWEVLGATARISEHFLVPVLEAVLHQFPFAILGFHVDNGSEYINHTVAQLLNKLLAEFTKSRPCRSLDNALVEGKNGAIIRKLMGWGHIPAEHAERIDQFYRKYLNPYLNFHRPCGFAQVVTDPRGKRRRRYPAQGYRTPYEKLKSLPQAEQYLKPGLSFAQLDRWAQAQSDTECARQMKQAKQELLRQTKIESPIPPPFRIFSPARREWLRGSRGAVLTTPAQQPPAKLLPASPPPPAPPFPRFRIILRLENARSPDGFSRVFAS